MARVIALIVILLVGFYVVWPGWSVYQITTALDTGDEATVSRKIVFKEVRAALRPAVEAKLNEAYDKLQSRTGEVGALLGGLRAQAVPAIATAALDTLVTPETLIDLAKDDRMLKENLQQLIAQYVEQARGGAAAGTGQGAASGDQPPSIGGIRLPGELGAVLGDIAGGKANQQDQGRPAGGQGRVGASTSATSAGRHTFGFDNIKSLRMIGPLGYAFGIAADASAAKPDATIDLRFVDFDWRVTAIRPNW